MTRPALAIRIAAAALLATAIFAGGRAALRSRLEAAAFERAARGDAAAITQTLTDWTDAVVPVAVTDDGRAGVRARLAVFERLDAHRARGDHERLVTDAIRALAVARRVSLADEATRSGVAWARRLAERLTNEAPRLDSVGDRLRLLTAAESVLRVTPLVRTRPKPAPPIVAKTEAVAVTRPAAPTDAESPKPPEPIRLSIPEPPEEAAALAPPPPSPWRPTWKPKATPPSPPEAVAASPPTVRDAGDNDRALLAELLESVESDAAGWRPEPSRARASGPISVAETDAERAARERRERLQRRLAERGFRGLATDQVAALLDPSPAVRARLADRLLTSRSGDAVRLLMLLVEDEDATVRAAAVAAMGASADRRLVEHAWRIAVADPDARVGRLAERLRAQLRQATLPVR
ncbi:MAG: hypothetical protein AAF805_02220 [Planctomycetota bacterium]